MCRGRALAHGGIALAGVLRLAAGCSAGGGGGEAFFQATAPDAAGATPLTSDVAMLDALPANPALRFLRFDVLFDVDAQSTGLSAPQQIPDIGFLRTPLRYE